MAIKRTASKTKSQSELPNWDQAKLAPFVLIKGNEKTLTSLALRSLRAQARAVDEQSEFIDISADKYEAGSLLMHTSPTLFGNKKFITFSNLSDLNDAALEDLYNYLDSPSPDSWIVACHSGSVRGKRLLDKIKKLNIPTYICPTLEKDQQKIAFLTAQIRAQGGSVSPDALGALVAALGSDLNELLSVTMQLISDCPGCSVQSEDVHVLLRGRQEVAGFDVAQACIEGNLGRSLELARHALATGTQPLLIVAAIATKLRQLAKVAGGGPQGPGSKASEGQLGMHPYVVKLTRASLRSWDIPALGLAIMATAHADEQVKGASLDPLYAVEKLLVDVCGAANRKKR